MIKPQPIDLASELNEIAARCEETASAIDRDPLKSTAKKLIDAAEAVAPSSSGSWIGYHSRYYYRGFRRPPAHDLFPIEWGLFNPYSEHAYDNWQEVDYEDIKQHIHRLAGNPDLKQLEEVGTEASWLFYKTRDDLVMILSALVDQLHTATLEKLRDEAKTTKSLNATQIAYDLAPSSVRTRDRAAMDQGMQPPHHVVIHAEILQYQMAFQALKDLASVARNTAAYTQRMKTIRKPSEHCVFIGHGRSLVWKDLRDFLERRLNLHAEEFNSEPVAGETVTDRIDELLKRCTLAFLVMTAEDEHADGTLHARENVIHETGRAEQKLGSKRAIVLLEEGCARFSNLQGIVYIDFPKGKIRAAFEDIREVLEREQIIEA